MREMCLYMLGGMAILLQNVMIIFHILYNRVVTRTLLILFEEPSVGPMDYSTELAFTEMEQVLKVYGFSKCLGWIIGIGKKLQEDHDVIEDCKTRLKGKFPPRVAQGWAVCTYIAKEVSHACTM